MRATAILLLSFATALLFANEYTVPPGKFFANQFKSAANNKQLSDIGKTLSQFDQQFDQAIANAVQRKLLVRKMQSQIKAHLTPQELVPLFFKNFAGKNKKEMRQNLSYLQQSLQTRSNQTGGISGRVTVSGIPPQSIVDVFAFDNHGYFAGSAEVSPETGQYTISGLRSDSFYVVTRSTEYIDQIYKNIEAPLGSMQTWRQAQKVFVPLATVNGIDFDLKEGVKVRGSITDTNGAPIEDLSTVEFVITRADNPLPIDTRSAETSNGRYEIVLPATGSFKMQATVSGYEPTWHMNQQNWADAAIFEISDQSTSPTVDFKLTKIPGAQVAGEVTGSIFPAFLAVSAAFSVEDTSFAQMGISLGLPNNYTIPDLPPGDYFIYADDYLGTLIGAGNYRGEFWDGADGTPYVKKAKPVAIAAGSTTEDINFLLDEGAKIQGTVVDHNDIILDSLTLVLLNADVLESGGDPFLAEFELHVVSTEFDGSYEIPGLRSGSYLLRTLSDFYLNFDLTSPDSILLPGKHKGNIVDQFYGEEKNLFRILDVEPIEIGDEDKEFNADFKLTPPHFISGKIVDAETAAPVTDVLVAALEDTSGYPFFPLGAIDSLGQYSIGPLPTGQYKVVALTGFSGENDYLTEYYNNQRSFYTADVIYLNQAMVADINFNLEKGAVIQGFVDLIAGDGVQYAGAETMDGMPVVAFNTENGTVASFDYVQFNGGYRINRLLPGTYKVATVPQPSGYATTYLGGGGSFDASENTILSLNFGDVTTDQIVELDKANGTITGTVTDSATGLPLSSVFVGAYDPTGHLVGYDLTDYDASTGLQTSANGHYAITGLRAGSYSVRTVSLFAVLPMVDDVLSFITIFEDFDLFGFLFGGSLTGLSFDFSVYKDLWHEAEPAALSINLDELVYQASAYGLPSGEDNALLPIYLPLPFYESIPTAAKAVKLGQDGSQSIDFILAQGGLGNIVAGVENRVKQPAAFSVRQNYPNPFNPSTTISFSLTSRQDVQILVYDVLGREVLQLTRQPYSAGQHKVTWNGRDALGRDVSAGIYIARVRAGEFEKSIKMVMVK